MASFVHVFKICTVFNFFFVLVCIILTTLTTFVYLQRKLALQLKSKHVKILKKQKNINTAQIKRHA